MQQYSPIITVMLKAARKAARILVRDYGEICHLQSSLKGLDNFVANAYKKAEKIIIDELVLARPNYGVMSREKIIQAEQDFNWIINAIEGEENFAHATAFFCMTIGLKKKLPDGKSEIIAAVIEAPILGETYIAEKGGGAWVEKHAETIASKNRLRVSARNSLPNALIALDEISNINFDGQFFEIFTKFNMKARINGSLNLGLAYLAAGKYDIILGNSNLQNNIAIGSLLVLEAGGAINSASLEFFKTKNINLIASNNKIDNEFVKLAK